MKKLILVILLMVTVLCGSAQTNDTLYLNGAVGKLFTIVQKPSMKKGAKLPVVILCHGFGPGSITDSPKSVLALTADDVVKGGMVAVRFNFNGSGKSEGEFQNMTVLNEIQDLKNVVKWVEEQPWAGEIGLVGHSQGGVVVSMTAGELGVDKIKCEALLAPAAVLRDDAIRGTTMGARYNPWNLKEDYVQLPGGGGRPGLKLGKDYIQSALSLPVYETAGNYSGPTLIMQGIQDRIVPYTYAGRYNQVINGSELHLIPEENHGFSVTTEATALLVAQWLKLHL